MSDAQRNVPPTVHLVDRPIVPIVPAVVPPLPRLICAVREGRRTCSRTELRRARACLLGLSAVLALCGCGGASSSDSSTPRDAGFSPNADASSQNGNGSRTGEIIPDQVGPYDLIQTAENPSLLSYGANQAILATYEGGATDIIVGFGEFGSEEQARQAVSAIADSLMRDGLGISVPSEVKNSAGEAVGIAVFAGREGVIWGDHAVIWTIGGLLLTARDSSVAGAADFFHYYMNYYNELVL